jgi:aspartate 1-decarboxylase
MTFGLVDEHEEYHPKVLVLDSENNVTEELNYDPAP